jgi:leucyl aminopeptidase (aminopeptidase T)
MLYREIIAVCSQIYTKHINTLCGQNVELLNVKLAVHIVTTDETEVQIIILPGGWFIVTWGPKNCALRQCFLGDWKGM